MFENRKEKNCITKCISQFLELLIQFISSHLLTVSFLNLASRSRTLGLTLHPLTVYKRNSRCYLLADFRSDVCMSVNCLDKLTWQTARTSLLNRLDQLTTLFICYNLFTLAQAMHEQIHYFNLLREPGCDLYDAPRKRLSGKLSCAIGSTRLSLDNPHKHSISL